MHCTHTQRESCTCAARPSLHADPPAFPWMKLRFLSANGETVRNATERSSSGRRQHTDRQKVAKEVKQSKRTMQWLTGAASPDSLCCDWPTHQPIRDLSDL
ncbi:hypothetical protein QQF64_032638 [Cirrhinus molitorella]|uniref:Uncharacterized protein n=1 Tax=Cirrhinus molitorella TaxID=172907 RepID=A0ABR3MRN0_9TELE